MFIKKLLLVFILLFSSLLNWAFAAPVLNIQNWKTKQGVPVFFVHTVQIPMVDIKVAFNAGSSRDDNEAGLANLTANMLGEGTTTLTADQIATRFDNLGAIFDASTTRDMSLISLRSLSKPDMLNASLPLFIDALTRANFPQISFARIKANTLQGIALQLQNPSYVAATTFYKNVYSNTPYATPVAGDAASVAQITDADVVGFYKKYYVAQNAMIVLVGDIDDAKAQDIAEKISASLPHGVAAPVLPMIKKSNPTTVQINFPVNQTTILFGNVGIAYNDPDNFPLLVGNYILGNDSTSRLFSIVREKYGLTYGIGSYFLPYAYNGPFVISLQTKNAQVQTALKITRTVISAYLSTGPTSQELEAAKDYLIGNFPLSLASNDAIANIVLAMGFYHLPANYLDTYCENVNAVTLNQIKSAMDKHIDLSRLVTIIVGGHASA